MKERVKKSNKTTTEKYYILFLLYLFILAIIGLVINNNIYFALAIIIIIILVLIFRKTVYRLIEKPITQRKRKINKRTQIFRMLYITIFVYVPIVFIIFLIGGNYSNNYIASERTLLLNISNNEANKFELISGNIQINPAINDNWHTKLQYILGNILNTPVLDICFHNNGTIVNSVINESFDSKVTLFNNTFNIPKYREYCEPIKLERQNIDYTWTTSYNYTISTQNPVPSENSLNSVVVNINDNFVIMSILIVIFWLGVCHLIYSIIKDFNRIK